VPKVLRLAQQDQVLLAWARAPAAAAFPAQRGVQRLHKNFAVNNQSVSKITMHEKIINQWEVNFWRFVWMARQQEKHIWKSLAACRFPKILSWQSDQNIRTAKFGDAPKWGCPKKLQFWDVQGHHCYQKKWTMSMLNIATSCPPFWSSIPKQVQLIFFWCINMESSLDDAAWTW
jgi:hypothetical protein